MSAPRRSRSVGIVAGAVLLVAATLAGIRMLGDAGPPVELPEYTVPGMEPTVAGLLSAERQRVIDAPRDAFRWANLGSALDAHEMNHEALQVYERALELDPALTETRYNRAIVLEFVGRAGDALVELQRVATDRPDFAPVFFRIGDLQLREGRDEEARAAFERALQLRPDDAAVRRSLGSALLALGDVEGAVRELTAVSRVAPEDRATHTTLARALGRAGRKDEARAISERIAAGDLEADTLSLADPLRHSVLSRAVDSLSCVERARELERAGNFRAAIRELERAAEGRPDRAPIAERIGRNYVRLGMPREAIPYFDRAVALDPTLANGYHNRGVANERLGNRSAAIEDYRRALLCEPDHSLAQERLRALGARP